VTRIRIAAVLSHLIIRIVAPRATVHDPDDSDVSASVVFRRDGNASSPVDTTP